MTEKYMTKEIIEELQKELIHRHPKDLEELLIARETYGSLWSITEFKDTPLQKESHFISTFTERYYDDSEGNNAFILCKYSKRLYVTFENYFRLFFPTNKFSKLIKRNTEGNLITIFKEMLKDAETFLNQTFPENTYTELAEYILSNKEWVVLITKERNETVTFNIEKNYNYKLTIVSNLKHICPNTEIKLTAEDSARIRKNLKNYPNSYVSNDVLIYCKNKGIINEWEYNFYKDIKTKKIKLTEKQENLKQKIHNTIIKKL